MPSSILSRSRRDSWPPTQVRLNPMLPAAMELSARDADEDPLNYFLTPAPGLEDPEGGDLGDMMDFDAGIEDPSHPREIVRSVSPSSLDGLDKTKRAVVAGSGGGRKSSPEPPELSDGMASPWDDDSDEDYIRFTPPTNKFGLPFSLRDFTLDGAKMKPRSFTAPVAGHKGSDAMLSPPPPITSRGAASRGRNPAAQGHSRGRSGPTPAGRRRPQHVWREPSPDVWSIEEETNEDLVDGQAGDHADAHMEGGINQHVEVPAAKPKKKVRFVLPVKE